MSSTPSHLLQARLVEQCGHHPLHDPDLGAQPECEQHHEEQAGPQRGAGDLGEHLCHDNEGEAGALGRGVQFAHQGAVPQTRSTAIQNYRIDGTV